MLMAAGAFLVIVSLLTYAFALGLALLRTYMGEKLTLGFRAKLFHRAQQLSFDYHDRKGTLDAVYRIQNDATALQGFAISGIVPLCANAVTLVAMIVVTARIDPLLAVVALAICPVLYLLMALSRRGVRPRWAELKAAESAALGVVHEVLAALRTVKSFNREQQEEKRFVGKDRRAIYYYGIDSPKRGPLVPPGTYTVKLSVAGKEQTQKLVVRRDPNSSPSDADLAAGTAFSIEVYRNINASARMINQLEWTRKQIDDLRKMQSAAKADKTLTSSVDDVEKKVRALEDRLMQPTLSEADLKSFRGPLGLYLKWVWLAAESGTGGGDVSGSGDHAPTAAEREVYDLLGRGQADAKRDFDELYSRSIPQFNEAMRAKGFGELVTVKEPEEPRPPTPPQGRGDDDEDAPR